MSDWLQPALAAAGRWLEYQQRASRLPGLQFAVAHRGQKVADTALGVRSALVGRTSRHRYPPSRGLPLQDFHGGRRHASRRDRDGCGSTTRPAVTWPGCKPTPPRRRSRNCSRTRRVSRATARTPASGRCAGRFSTRPSYAGSWRKAPSSSANTRFKYSNHGFGLLGLIIEQITGEPYAGWIAREVVARAALTQTSPDGPLPADVPYRRRPWCSRAARGTIRDRQRWDRPAHSRPRPASSAPPPISCGSTACWRPMPRDTLLTPSSRRGDDPAALGASPT